MSTGTPLRIVQKAWHKAMRELGVEDDAELPPISAFVETSPNTTPSKKARDSYSRRNGKSSEIDRHNGNTSPSEFSETDVSPEKGEFSSCGKMKSPFEDKYVDDTSSSDAYDTAPEGAV